MDLTTLEKYLKAFAELKRNKASGHGLAPHKPILLLAVLDETKQGRIENNFIELTPELVASFQSHWKALVTDDYWQPKIEYPFRHLYQEGFWDFLQYGHIVAPEPMTYSLKQLCESFDGACLAPDLWQLFQNGKYRDALY
jgi:putative restriction endonuclease